MGQTKNGGGSSSGPGSSGGSGGSGGINCYPSDSMLIVRTHQGWKHVRADEVEDGAEVLTMDAPGFPARFVKALFNFHGKDDKSRCQDYLEVLHDAGVFRVTKEHLVETPSGMVMASALKPGSCLQGVEVSEHGFQSVTRTVVSIREVAAIGMNGHLTTNSKLVVDGIVVSSFSLAGLADRFVGAGKQEPAINFFGDTDTLQTFLHWFFRPLVAVHLIAPQRISGSSFWKPTHDLPRDGLITWYRLLAVMAMILCTFNSSVVRSLALVPAGLVLGGFCGLARDSLQTHTDPGKTPLPGYAVVAGRVVGAVIAWLM